MRPRRGLLTTLLFLASACGSGGGSAPPPTIVVLTAFPAELAPFVSQMQIEATAQVSGRTVREGTLAGVKVVVAMTGIGLLNAAATAAAVLDAYAVDGVVVSGVAGSPYRIGDVVVPEAWMLRDGSAYRVHAPWLRVAERLAGSDSLVFDRCTEIPVRPAEQVCVPHAPAIAVGGAGRSDDSFAVPLQCDPRPNASDVFGCDVAPAVASHAPLAGAVAAGAVMADEPVAVDQETAAVAREAAARGVPFIAFRAVSDGEGDPLDLPGFPEQFFTYYRLAARNAARVTLNFLAQL